MAIKIERVTEKDCEEILEIYRPYVEKTAISFEYEAPSYQEFEDRIRNISARYPYLKAVDDGQILGYAYATAFKSRKAYDWSVETTVYVREDQKRKGIGRLLYQELEKELKAMGILNMNACIAVPGEKGKLVEKTCEDAQNDETISDDSMNFHEKMGFALVGRFHDSGYKFNSWYDMIWMEKMIGEHTNYAENVKFGMSN